MFELAGLEGSTKKNVVLLLSQEWPLGIKEIQSRLDRQGVNVSYQAIHKAVNELFGQKILNKLGSEFQLNEEWISSHKSFFEKLSKAYESNLITDLEKPIHLVFENLQELIKFLIDEYYIKYPNPERKPCACIWNHAYPLLGASKKEIENVKKFFKYAKHYALTKHDTPLDKVFSDLLIKFGKECYTGVKIPTKIDTFLQGDLACQVFYENNFQKEWDSIYVKHKELNDKALENLFDFVSKKTEINVLIVKNASFAEKLRKDCERIVERLERK